MPTRLKQVKVREGSLVDEPANPRARVVLFKRDEPEAHEDQEALDKAADKPMKTENGMKFPAEAYAYVPDPEKPSTWKLRLWETPEQKETARQVGMAVAALGPGFRGNKVEIPAEDLPKVIARVRAAWRKVHPDAKEEDMPEVLRKSGEDGGLVRRILDAIGKALGLSHEQLAKAEQEVMTFNEVLTLQEAESELWDYISALQQSIRSILQDPSATDKEALIRGSLDQFVAAVEAAVPNWLAGAVNKVGRKISAERLARLKQAWEALGAVIREAEGGDEPAGADQGSNDNQGVAKGADDEVSVTLDKSKLPEDVRQHVEQLEKRVAELEQELAKAKGQPAEDDILKNLPEPIRKRLEEAERRAREAEEVAKAEREARLQREYLEKARAYSNVGKPEDLAAMLRQAYEVSEEYGKQLEATLKAANERIAQGALFAEVGKSGSGPVAGSAEAEIEAKAQEMVSKGLAKSKAEAVVKVLEQHPDLAKRYHQERNG